MDAECAALRARYGEGKSSEVPGTEDARTLYKALGLDPTKTRPSNEALLRRALKGETLYRINTLVDALNLSSLREQLPLAYTISIRYGRPSSCAWAERARPTRASARARCRWRAGLSSSTRQGPFGNPTSDSLRTCITLATTRCLVVGYAPAGYATARLDGVLDRTAAALTQACGGTVGVKRQLP